MSESFQRRSPVRFYNWISMNAVRKVRMEYQQPLPNECCILFTLITDTTPVCCSPFVHVEEFILRAFFFFLNRCTLLRYQITAGRWHSFFSAGVYVCVSECSLLLLHNFTATDSCYSYISKSPTSWLSHFLVFTCCSSSFLRFAFSSGDEHCLFMSFARGMPNRDRA